MSCLELSSLFLFFLPALLLLLNIYIFKNSSSSKFNHKRPASYPLIGSLVEIFVNRNRITQWTSDILQSSPSSTFLLRDLVGGRWILTANPSNVHHILRTKFQIYNRGNNIRTVLSNFFGDGSLTADGEHWKFLRQMASHVLNGKAFRKLDDTVVEAELSGRLLPILSAAAANKTILDLQDIFERFTFDIIYKVACGYDIESLVSSLSKVELPEAFDFAVSIIVERYKPILPLIWKTKRLLDVGSEKTDKDCGESSWEIPRGNGVKEEENNVKRHRYGNTKLGPNSIFLT